jgi:hypothetical protein
MNRSIVLLLSSALIWMGIAFADEAPTSAIGASE